MELVVLVLLYFLFLEGVLCQPTMIPSAQPSGQPSGQPSSNPTTGLTAYKVFTVPFHGIPNNNGSLYYTDPNNDFTMNGLSDIGQKLSLSISIFPLQWQQDWNIVFQIRSSNNLYYRTVSCSLPEDSKPYCANALSDPYYPCESNLDLDNSIQCEYKWFHHILDE